MAEGLFLASRRVEARPESERMAATVRAYERRARFRPTPHGVFAGVATAQVTDGAPELILGSVHRVRTRVTPAWLTSLADQLYDQPAVLAGLTLTTSNLVVRRGDRFEQEQQATPGVAGPQRVSVRATEACALVLDACRRGASYPRMVTEIHRRWPAAPEGVIRASVLQLVRAGFLLTDLLGHHPDDNPLQAALSKLPSSCTYRPQVAQLRDHLQAADGSPPGHSDRFAHLRRARTVCDELVEVERPLQADVAADARVAVPSGLVAEAVEAAGVLWRISPQGPVLAEYHRRFLDRYGPNRFVPLLDVVDPVIGLGDVDDPTDTGDGDRASGRGEVLASLLHQALTRGWMEVQLDEDTVDALATPGNTPPPPTGEVYARVFASCVEDLAAGRLSLAIYGGGTQQAGSTLARFTGLLPDARLPVAGEGGGLVAELAVRPRTPELATITRPSGWADLRIPIGMPPREGDVELADLLLVSRGGRLQLWSADLKRPLEPVLYSRIGPRYLPPLARLLQQVSVQGCRPLQGWSWRPMHHGLFHPRLRYRRAILSPARWRLPEEVRGAARDRARWPQALKSWRAAARPHPPRVVVVEDADRHLPLDLDHAPDQELLRRYVGRGCDRVAEQPGGPDAFQGVLSGPERHHALELVIPLQRQVSHASHDTAPPQQARARPTGEARFLPGSEWLSLVLPTPAEFQDAVLGELVGLATELAPHVDRWFWLRYANAQHGPHLRVRFRGTPTALGAAVLPAVAAWGADLHTRRLARSVVVEPYDQEIERYGGPQAITAAEQVFDADSRLVLATLTASPQTEDRLVVAALSAAAIARALTCEPRAAVHPGGVDRPTRRRINNLRPRARAAADAGTPPGLRPQWRTRDAALADYRNRVEQDRRQDCASSLVHMHSNRILGDHDSEHIARGLAADLLARKERQ